MKIASPPRAGARFRPQDGTQDDPRSTQDGSKTIFKSLLFSTSFSTSILVRHEPHFDLILAPLWAPKCRGPQGLVGPKTTLNDPWRLKAAQDRSKTASRPPKSLPRAAQDPPRFPKDPPRRPKTTKNRPNTPPNRLGGELLYWSPLPLAPALEDPDWTSLHTFFAP